MRTNSEQQRIVLANWKANLSPVQAEQWLADFSSLYRPHARIRVILAVPCLSLCAVHNRCREMENVSLAVQDVSPFPLGNYTGSTPAAWLRETAEYVLVGHRERRKYFHETVQDAANKVSEAVAEEIRPILCVDRATARQQATAIEYRDMEHLVVAYTPDDAEQLEVARSVAAVAEGARQVGEAFRGCPVVYGGGVHKGNVAGLFRLDQLSGVMVAAGSIDPRAFAELLRNAADSIAA